MYYQTMGTIPVGQMGYYGNPRPGFGSIFFPLLFLSLISRPPYYYPYYPFYPYYPYYPYW